MIVFQIEMFCDNMPNSNNFPKNKKRCKITAFGNSHEGYICSKSDYLKK